MRKIIFTLIVLLLIGSAPPIFHESESQSVEGLIGQLMGYGLMINERTMVITDKDYYEKGETIWFRIFLTNGLSNQEKPYSGVLYTELLDDKGQIVDRSKLKVSESGAYGNFSIKNNWDAGKYYLRAFTKLMLNNEVPRVNTKSLYIDSEKKFFGNENEKRANVVPEIMVRSEGGSLVHDVMATIGVQAIGNEGLILGGKGQVLDDIGNVVTHFNLISPGYGKASFLPNFNREYKVVIRSGGYVYEKELPTVKKEGYSLSVKERESHFVANLVNTEKNGLKGSFLLVHSGEKTLISYEFGKELSENSKLLKIDKDKIEANLITFSLFDKNGNIQCQRQIYSDGNLESHRLILETEKEKIKKGDSILLKLNNPDVVKGNISLAVTPIDRIIMGDNNYSRKIIEVKDPFRKWEVMRDLYINEPLKKKEVWDAIMILDSSNGIDWGEVKQFDLNTLKYKPELGIMISGHIKAENYNDASKTSALLTVAGEAPFQETVVTNDSGKFKFGPFMFYDSLNVIIQANNLGGKQFKENNLVIDVVDEWPKVGSLDVNDFTSKNDVQFNRYLKEGEYVGTVDFDEDVTLLEEVVVTSKTSWDETKIDKELSKLTPYLSYDYRVMADALRSKIAAVSAMDLLMEAPGVYLFGSFPNQKAVIRGVGSINESNDPLFLLNGVPVSKLSVQQMLAEEIMFVDVIKGGRTAAFGARGGNGVIAFYSRRGKLSKKLGYNESLNWVNTKVSGFSRSGKFADMREKKEKLSSIYWEPFLGPNKSTVVHIDRNVSSGTYLVILYGMDKNGNPIREEKAIEIIE